MKQNERKCHATISSAMNVKETERTTDFLVKTYEKEVIAEADLLLTTKDAKDLPLEHSPFGILVLFSSEAQLKKAMRNVHLDWVYAENWNMLSSSAEEILTRDLGYSYETLQDARKEYEKCRSASEHAEKNYLDAQKKLHRLKTSLKNTQLQNQWLARENSSHDEMKKAAGKEAEELTARMEALHPKMESLQEESDTQEAELIPLIRRAEDLQTKVTDLKENAARRRESLKFRDKVLHPSKYKNDQESIAEMELRISDLQKEIDRISTRREEGSQKLEETRNRLRQISDEYVCLEKKKKESSDALEKHRMDLEGGSRMVDEGQMRLKQVQSRIQYEEGRLDSLLTDAVKKRNHQFESAMVLVHTWIGWADDYRRDLEKITSLSKQNEEIPSDLIEKEFFAPFLFVSSEPNPAWLKNQHLFLLFTDHPVSAEIRKCFRKIV